MDTSTIKKLLINIPVKMCRNLNQNLINSILRELNYDISQHHLSILKLLDETQRANITEVVEHLNITKPQMTASTDKLVMLDYIVRENDVADRRKIYISLTKKGKEVVSAIDEHMNILADEALSELSDYEMEQLGQGLKILEKLCINCQDKNHETSI